MNRKFFKLWKIFKLLYKTNYRKDTQNSTEKGKIEGSCHQICLRTSNGSSRKCLTFDTNVSHQGENFLSWFTELIISFLGSKNIFSVNLIIYVPKLVHIYCSRKVEQIIQTARPSHACHNYFFRCTYLK